MTAPLSDDNVEEASAFEAVMPARPYPGLRPFDEVEWPIFFGRERMVDAVVGDLIRRQFVAVHGDSGAGKSSLIRAGVLPRLRQEYARGGLGWRTCIALPRGGPLRNLARALAAIDGRADDVEHVLNLRRALNQGRRAPAALAELMLGDEGAHLCILLDQFEELFEFARQQGHAEAQLLTDFLVTMARTPPRGLYVAVTMRSEFLGACARFPGLAEAVNDRQYLLPPMSTADLVRAICEPAALYDGVVDAAVADRLAADASGPDGLPLVQHALMLMHRAVGGQTPWRLTANQYPADGLPALLSQHADAVAANAASETADRLVEDVFRALTAITADGHAVRRPLSLAGLIEATGAPREAVVHAVDVFRADGVSFLVAHTGPRPLADDDWIDIGHEALIRCWRALADPKDGWLAREVRNGLVWRSLLVQADSFERDPSNVLSEATTEERQRWLVRRNPQWAERYGGGWHRVQSLIGASVKARDLAAAQLEQARDAAHRQRMRARRNKVIASMTAIAALLLAAFGYVTTQARQRESLARQQESLARQQESERVRQLQNSNARIQSLLDQTRQSEEKLRKTWGELQSALTSSDSALRKQVSQASSELRATADMLQQTETAPRIYIHIGDMSQRMNAETLRRALDQSQFGDVKLLVPGVQLVSSQTNTGVLRCFDADECKDEAKRLQALLNGLIASPELALQDLSKQYGNSSKIRPHHYEVWFGRGPLTLQPAVQVTQ
jgi:hypothetical protein